MTTTQRRIALFTGASLATIGLAVPAYAAPHSALADGTYPGVSTASDTVVICDLATPPGSPCFFGVIDTTGATSTATVDLFVNGQVQQAATGTVSMANNGSAEHGAIASANNGAGNATATANSPALLRQLGGARAPISRSSITAFGRLTSRQWRPPRARPVARLRTPTLTSPWARLQQAAMSPLQSRITRR